MQQILSALALIVFFLLLGGRAVMLRKKGIRAIVFGETDRSDFLLLPVFFALAYAIFAPAFGFRAPNWLLGRFWVSAWTGGLGLLLEAAALIGFAAALKSFGNSFRVGIDEVKPDALVTGGMFAVSRNPVYVCFLIFFLGQFLVNPCLALAVVLPLLALAIHRQILREEAFLRQHYGAEYQAYCARVRRYL
jgi:protein-S-isoprenylcysteine O-methyltransferase Ste14